MDVTIVAVQAVNAKSNRRVEWVDVTKHIKTRHSKPGMLEVTVNLPKAVRNAKLFEFRVVHEDRDKKDKLDKRQVRHWGMIVFDRRHNKNLGMGQ